MKVTDLLHQDHEAVKGLMTQLEGPPSNDTGGRQRLLDEIAEELEIHSKAEEELFYPAVRKIDSEVVEHAKEEHEQITRALGDAEGRDPAQTDFTAKVAELTRTVLYHVSLLQRGVRAAKQAARKIA